jgi:predicted DNA-binding protein
MPIRLRMHVTPTETAYRLLGELSKLTGDGRATIVRELLDEAVPALEMAIEAIRSVKKRPEHMQAVMAQFSARAINELTQAQLDLDSAMKKKPGRKPKPKGPGAANTG